MRLSGGLIWLVIHGCAYTMNYRILFAWIHGALLPLEGRQAHAAVLSRTPGCPCSPGSGLVSRSILSTKVKVDIGTTSIAFDILYFYATYRLNGSY